MKNFEEWYVIGKIGFWKDNDIQVAQRKAWKAALEWVNEMFNLNIRHDTGIYIVGEIEKELGEEE